MEKSSPPPLRKKNRLEKWLYTTGGFFVTICVQEKISYFGDIDIDVDMNLDMNVGADSIRLNTYGETIKQNILNIPSVYKNVTLGDFVIMPNHIHMIVFIDNEKNKAIDNRPYGLLSQIIKGFKQITSKQLHTSGLTSFKRQKSFYDHVIRNDQDLLRIQEYIHYNPYRWKNDEYYR